MRMNKLITKGKLLLSSIFEQCMEISQENLYADIAAQRVKISLFCGFTKLTCNTPSSHLFQHVFIASPFV